jgi:D-alanyl-D-alanine carboxypeptidase/D-alanyl-D-alanine-endopeptidase (penicillin-binding protein 4)
MAPRWLEDLNPWSHLLFVSVYPGAVSRPLAWVLLAVLLGPPVGAQPALPAPPAEPDDDEGADDLTATPRPPAGLAPAARAAWLDQRIDDIVAAHPELGHARIGVAVVDTATGALLAERAGDQQLRIASVSKVLTAAAALSLQGGQHRYVTALLADERTRSPDRAVIAGDLVLRAGGDPTLTTLDLDDLASDLAAAGLRRVQGALVIDVSAFDGQTLPPAFDQKDDAAAFRAPIAAAALDADAVTITVVPGATDGAPARATTSAGGSYLELVVEAVTTERGRTALAVATEVLPDNPPRLKLTVSGTMRTDATPSRIRRRIDSPHHFLGETFRQRLAAHGIRVGQPRLAFRAASLRARLIAVHESEPLAVVLRALGKHSNNFVAEMVLKGLAVTRGGPPATFAQALTLAQGALARLGLPPGSYRLDNGSGLYDSSAVSARQLSTVLVSAWRDFALAPDFVAHLSQAGVDGTLTRRMTDGPARGVVRAKTGTLDDVIALAGYAGSTRGQPLAFAVVVNGLTRRDARAARGLCDQVAQAAAALAATP